MGLGWWLHKNNHDILDHGGGTGSFGSFLVIDKSKKLAVVVLSNYRLGINSERKIGLSILENLSKK